MFLSKIDRSLQFCGHPLLGFYSPYTDNYIDGTEFMGLTELEIKEIVPPMGLAKKIIKLIPKVSFYFYPTISCRFLVHCAN